jgi:hypothetical protein
MSCIAVFRDSRADQNALPHAAALYVVRQEAEAIPARKKEQHQQRNVIDGCLNLVMCFFCRDIIKLWFGSQDKYNSSYLGVEQAGLLQSGFCIRTNGRNT